MSGEPSISGELLLEVQPTSRRQKYPQLMQQDWRQRHCSQQEPGEKQWLRARRLRPEQERDGKQKPGHSLRSPQHKRLSAKSPDSEHIAPGKGFPTPGEDSHSNSEEAFSFKLLHETWRKAAALKKKTCQAQRKHNSRTEAKTQLLNLKGWFQDLLKEAFRKKQKKTI